MEYLIGVDIGTQGTKGCLVRRDGTQIAAAFEPSRLIYGKNGAVEQSPQEILDSVVRVLHTLAQTPHVQPQEICGIGIDGQMAGIMGIDADFSPVTPYDSWLDTRCEPYILQMKQQAGKEIILTTGCPVTYAHGPKILWWMHERPEIFAKIERFVTLTCFVTGKLAGLRAQDAYLDYTQLHFSGFGDVERLQWSDSLLAQFCVPKQKLPRIVSPWERVGSLTAEMALRCGLPAGLPLVAGCGDQAATSLGAGIVTPGQAFDVAGTASVFSCCVDQYRPDTQHETIIFARSVLPRLWVPLAYVNGGGMCLKWFVQEILQLPAGAYAQLDAESAPIERGSGGLLFVPHFSGRVCPNVPSVKGSWLGLSWNHTRAHLFRAVMESIGYEYAMYLEEIRRLVPQAQCNVVTAIGGGAKSEVFNQIKADILGVQYQALQLADTAPLGSALLAGHAADLYPDLAEQAQSFAVRAKQTLLPGANAASQYGPQALRYRRVLDQLPLFYATEQPQRQ